MHIRFAPAVLLLPVLIAMADFARAQATSRVSVDSAGIQGNSNSFIPSISADGRYVAFHSDASNLVSGDTNFAFDVFVHDRQTGETSRVSVDSAGIQGDLDSFNPSISADGRYVAFDSDAINFVSGDTNDFRDVFIHDRQTGETSRVSVDSAGILGDVGGGSPSISADGRYVAFWSSATNLVSGDTNDFPDVFIHDRQTGETSRLSVDSAGIQGNSNSLDPSISADGRYVAFHSDATNLVSGDTNLAFDVFVHDRQTGETSRVSVDSAGIQGRSHSGIPSISADGRYVAFVGNARNLVSGDTNRRLDVFVHDRQTGETSRVSVDSAGIQGDSHSAFPSISADGRYVAFDSDATNLVSGDMNDFRDVFVHDRQTGQTSRVSVDSAGIQGDLYSDSSSISADGGYVAFHSKATNMASGDTNGAIDVFLRESRDPAVCRAGTVNSDPGPITDVLTINGNTGVVTEAIRDPIEIVLDAAPLGPNPARYFALVWLGYPSNPFDLRVGVSTLGCMVNPTPFKPLATPQALQCLRGTGVPSAVCRGITEVPSPTRAPWTVMKNGGFGNPIVLTLQAVLEDDGAGNPSGFSVTNAVTLKVE